MRSYTFEYEADGVKDSARVVAEDLDEAKAVLYGYARREGAKNVKICRIDVGKAEK